jgi:hypothetical protein
LALECPWKLFIFNFAGLEQKLVGVHVDTGGLKADLDFDAISRGMRVKIKEGMLVTQQFALDFLEKFVHWGNRRSFRGHTGRGHTRHAGGAKTLPVQQIVRVSRGSRDLLSRIELTALLHLGHHLLEGAQRLGIKKHEINFLERGRPFQVPHRFPEHDSGAFR